MIPDFQSLMRPLLEHLSDGRDRENAETLEAMAARFELTAEERAELLPSGKQPVFVNRLAWAKSHLKGAGLIESPRRAVYRITPAGLDLLKQSNGPVNMKTLEQFESYREYRGGGTTDPEPAGDRAGGDADLTPEELMERGYTLLRKQLAAEILQTTKRCPPEFFERLVVEVLVAMGYGGSRIDAGRAVGRPGDGGIDGIIKEDKLGLDTIYIQAKRREGTVGRPEIQKFAGALQGVRARKGIFITTSSFSGEAEQYAKHIDNKIVLIDGPHLASLMFDHGVGVTATQTYQITRLDSDYFLTDG